MELTSAAVVAIIAVSITIMLAGFMALWRLTNTIRDRPTAEYIDGKFDTVTVEITELKIESGKQGVTLKNIETTVSRLARRAESQPIVAVNSQD